MGLEPRPGARGGRAAQRAYAREREQERLEARGVIANLGTAGEIARAEAINCPICRQPVHPTNWSAHMALKHTDKIIPLHEADPGRLPITAIRMDGGTQSREQIDFNLVADYAEKMKEGREFPAIDVWYDGESYWVSDGFHRIHASKQVGLTDIKATVHQGALRDAILHSVGVNDTHGLRRTNADKHRAVNRLLDDDEWGQWSNSEIARRCVVSEFLVRSLRLKRSDANQIRTFTTKHGTTATMNTGNIGKATPPVRYGQSEDDYQPDVPEVQVDENGEPEYKNWHDETPEGKRMAAFGGRDALVQHIHSGQIGKIQFMHGDIAHVDTDNGRKLYHWRYLKKFEDTEQAEKTPDQQRPKPSTSVAYMRNIYDAWRGGFKDGDLVLITQDGATYIAIGRDDGILRFKANHHNIQPGSIGLHGGADYTLVSKIDAALLHEIEQQYSGAVIAISYADLDDDMQYVAGTAFRARNIPLNVSPSKAAQDVDLTKRAEELGAEATIIEGVNYKRDSKVTRPATPSESQPYDRMQTPPYALDPLLPYLGWSLPSTIWEPACGEGLIVEALYDAGWKEEHVIGTDILTDQNFFNFQPDKWEVIVTNPPYSLKIEWLERAYQLHKPFALLLPIDALGSGQVQALIQQHGFEVMFLNTRVDFKMPVKGWDSHAQFATFWLCHDLLPEKVMFGDIKAAKKAFKTEIGDMSDDDPE